MRPATTAKKRGRPPAGKPQPLPPDRIGLAFDRLLKHRALDTVVRGTLPPAVLKRLLRDQLPKQVLDLPTDVLATVATNLAAQDPLFGLDLAEALHDRLSWDREPAGREEWQRLIADQPLQALWMAACSESGLPKKDLAPILDGALRAYRTSPACPPPSWDHVEALLDAQGQRLRAAREAERHAEEAERRFESERERVEDLREELKRLRREVAELKAENAEAVRREASLAARPAASPDPTRVEELERRLRKAEKEREHLWRELDRLKTRSQTAPNDEAAAAEASDAEPLPEGLAPSQNPLPPGVPPPSEDPNPRRRLLRQILRRLFKKGKIGASHTQEDNVLRSIADHEKGLAREAVDLLYREGLLLPKHTTTDPHISLSPSRAAEIQAVIAGHIENPRLLRFCGD